MADIDNIMSILRQWYQTKRKEEESRKEAEKFEQEEAERKEALRRRLEETKRLDEENHKSQNRVVSTGPVSPEQARRLEAEEAEKRVKDRIQQRQANNKSDSDSQDTKTTTNAKRTLSASEKRAIEAEKRALLRKERMRELEEDALKAQIVIAQVKAMSASSLESLPLGSPDGPRKSSSSENEFNDGGFRRSSSGSTAKST